MPIPPQYPIPGSPGHPSTTPTDVPPGGGGQGVPWADGGLLGWLRQILSGRGLPEGTGGWADWLAQRRAMTPEQLWARWGGSQDENAAAGQTGYPVHQGYPASAWYGQGNPIFQRSLPPAAPGVMNSATGQILYRPPDATAPGMPTNAPASVVQPATGLGTGSVPGGTAFGAAPAAGGMSFSTGGGSAGSYGGLGWLRSLFGG